jgi:hypothetical protein
LGSILKEINYWSFEGKELSIVIKGEKKLSCEEYKCKYKSENTIKFLRIQVGNQNIKMVNFEPNSSIKGSG